MRLIVCELEYGYGFFFVQNEKGEISYGGSWKPKRNFVTWK
jgi:hypothetical protein